MDYPFDRPAKLENEMKAWWIRSNEAFLVAPHVDVLGFMVGHCSDPTFQKKIDMACATADRLGKKALLWQLLWRIDERRVSEALTSEKLLEENLRISVGGLGLNVLTGLDTETYSDSLRYVLDQPLALALVERIRSIGQIFDFVTPELRSPFTRSKAPRWSMYAELGRLGERGFNQSVYRNYTGNWPTFGPTDVAGTTISNKPMNHEYTPAEVADPKRWFNQPGCDIGYFPIGDIMETAKEFAKVMETRK
jgi:hypothetical protein